MRWMLLVCLPAAGLYSVGLAQDAPAPRVGDVTVRAEDVLDRLVSDFGATLLEELIAAKLVEQAAAAAGITVSEEAAFERFLVRVGDVPPEEQPELLASQGLTLDVALRQARVELLADALIGRQVQVTEEEVAKLFEERRAIHGTPERRLIAHLVYEQENEAHRGADELRRGAVAGQDTIELRHKPANLAEANPLDVVAFRDLTTPNQVSQPILIDGGWHVVRVESILPAQEATLEECYDLLHGQILAQKSEALRRTWLQELREKAGVDIRVTFR
jgi:hypothetical protein